MMDYPLLSPKLLLAATLFATGSATFLQASSPDGYVWTPVGSGTTQTIRSVSAASSDYAVASGLGGTLLVYDGSTWSPFQGWEHFRTTDPGWNNATHLSVITFGPDKVWVASRDDGNGRLAHWDGLSWTYLNTGTSFPTINLWGVDESFVLGGRSNGYVTTVINGEPGLVISGAGVGKNVFVGGSATNDIWAVGDNVLRHSTDGGATWKSVTGPAQYWSNVFSLGVNQTWFSTVRTSPETPGDVYFYDGETFISLGLNANSNVNSMYVEGPDSIWAVGGSGLAKFYDGTTWHDIDLGGFTGSLQGIMGLGNGEIWLVGQNGAIFQGVVIPEPRAIAFGLVGISAMLLFKRKLGRC